VNEGFVTLAEAAHLLGVSERTVQRRAAKLPESDRQMADNGRVLVRQSALGVSDTCPTDDRQEIDSVRQRGDKTAPDEGERVGQARQSDRQSDRHVSDTGVTDDRQMTDSLIEHLQGEVTYLRSALDKSQSLQLAALGEAAAMRGRVEALEKQNQALIEAKPGDAEKPTDPTEGDSTKPDGSTVAPEGQSAQNQAVEGERGVSAPGWWRRMFGGGSR
jgi:hypothetical protein